MKTKNFISAILFFWPIYLGTGLGLTGIFVADRLHILLPVMLGLLTLWLALAIKGNAHQNTKKVET